MITARIGLLGPALLLIVLAGSCGSVGDLLGGMPKPSVDVAGVRLDGLDLTGVTMGFDLDVKNPLAAPLPVAKLDYALSSSGNPFLSGSSDYQGTVPAQGHQMIPVSARVTFADALRLISGLKPGAVVPYKADLGVSVDVPGIGTQRLPVSHDGELPFPTVPEVQLGGIRWEELSLARAKAVLDLAIGNANEFPVDLNALNLDLALGGVPVVQTGVRQALKFAAGQQRKVEVPVEFTPSSLGLGAFRMLTGAGAQYGLKGSLLTETPFGPLNFPLDTAGSTAFRR